MKPTEKKGKLQNVQWHQWLKGYNKVYRLERVSPFPIHDLNQLSLHAEFVVFYKLLSLLPNLISMDSFSATILVVISTLISKEAKIFTTKASISVASDVKSGFVDWQVSNRPPRQTETNAPRKSLLIWDPSLNPIEQIVQSRCRMIFSWQQNNQSASLLKNSKYFCKRVWMLGYQWQISVKICQYHQFGSLYL